MAYFKLTENQKQDMINNCIDRTVVIDGFVFSYISTPSNIFMNIYATDEPLIGYRTYSKRTLDEHIEFINRNNVRNLYVCANNLDFLSKCKPVKCVMILQPNNNSYIKDYSALYDMENLEAISLGGYLPSISLHASNRNCEKINYNITFKNIKKLKQIDICEVNRKFKTDIHLIEHLEILAIMDLNKKNLKDYFCSEKLKSLKISNSKLENLDGIEKSKTLEWFSLIELNKLHDISSLERVKDSLKALSIWNCPKIEDYSVLNKLENLEHLELYGNKNIPDLSFLKKMKKLKTLLFSINVEDGDLTNCLDVPCVFCLKERKHYNFKNKELPKNKEYVMWCNFQNHIEDVF